MDKETELRKAAQAVYDDLKHHANLGRIGNDVLETLGKVLKATDTPDNSHVPAFARKMGAAGAYEWYWDDEAGLRCRVPTQVLNYIRGLEKEQEDMKKRLSRLEYWDFEFMQKQIEKLETKE
jgi:hypothetical protein